jgi:bisphosphoglycerate-independent phosphoglycerate mutase (AlkP superfamily)
MGNSDVGHMNIRVRAVVDSRNLGAKVNTKAIEEKEL